MKPETKVLYDASQLLFKQMRENGTDPEKVKKLNDENISTLKKALEIEPNNPQLWFDLGNTYTWLSTTGTLQDGLKAYAKAEDLVFIPGTQTLWLELADAVSASRERGADDGNRTHVTRPAPADRSITHRCR